MTIKSFHISNLGLNPTTDARFAPGFVDRDGYVSYESELYDTLRARLDGTDGWKEAKRVREEIKSEYEATGELDNASRNAYRLAIKDADKAVQLREED